MKTKFSFSWVWRLLILYTLGTCTIVTPASSVLPCTECDLAPLDALRRMEWGAESLRRNAVLQEVAAIAQQAASGEYATAHQRSRALSSGDLDQYLRAYIENLRREVLNQGKVLPAPILRHIQERTVKNLSPQGTIPSFEMLLNGKKIIAALDFGAGISSTNAATVNEFKLVPIAPLPRVRDSFGNLVGTNLVKASLDLGAAIFQNSSVLVLDDFRWPGFARGTSTPEKSLEPKFALLLGTDVLNRLRVNIDSNKGTITFATPNQSKLIRNLWWLGKLVTVCAVNNQKVIFEIDSGANRSFVASNFARNAELKEKSRFQADVTTLAGKKSMELIEYKNIRCENGSDSLLIKSPIGIDKKRTLINSDGALGADFFRGKNTTIDFSAGEFISN